MTMAQAKRLKVGESFSRPSSNPHDNGNRVYTVCSLEPYLEFVDQHGYHRRAVLNAHDKPFFKDAVKLCEVCKGDPSAPLAWRSSCHKAVTR